MGEEIIEFTVSGSPRVISRAIEEFAAVHGSLQRHRPCRGKAIKLFEHGCQPPPKPMAGPSSTPTWAPSKLTDIGNDSTRVAFSPAEPDHPEKKRLVALFDGFAHQVQSKLQTAP